MSVNRNVPELAALLLEIEHKLQSKPTIYEDFINLKERILRTTNERLSETTLERVWGYSTRGYANISVHTLDVLSRFAGHENWQAFCKSLKSRQLVESDIFDKESVSTDELTPGDRLTIGWQPNRKCTVRYLGDNLFVAEKTENSKLQPGDTFSCLQFQLGAPLIMENLTSGDGRLLGRKYGVGLKNGLSMLQLQN